MENNSTSILGVLSGKDAVKITVAVNPVSIVLVAVSVMVAVTIGVLIAKKIS